MSQYLLKLYIAGKTARTERALENLRRICDAHVDVAYQIEVIDVLERPELAEEARVLATPTVIRVLPPPARRVIGDLTETERVLVGLDLQPLHAAPTPPS